jgi:phosphoglycerate dehydrogenase-like enzyme
MKEIKLVTYGRLSEEFETYILSEQPHINVIRPVNERQLISTIRDANAVAGFDFLEHLDLSNIEWIHSFGAGVDSFLTKTSDYEHNITITRTIGKLGDKIGEYCLTYALAQCKHIFQTYKQQQHKNWNQNTGENLFDKSVLILGTGTIGKGVASAFNKKVQRIVGVNSSGIASSHFDDVKSWKKFKNENFKIIINTLPNTPNTKGILNKHFFSQFNNALFINVGRGDTVDDMGLIKALDNNHLSSAVLDVFKKEPLPITSKLWEHDKIIVTPHQSGLTTIEDVKQDFEQAYLGLKNNTKNKLFVNAKRGY